MTLSNAARIILIIVLTQLTLSVQARDVHHGPVITRTARYACLPFRESPFPAFTGIHPMTPGQAETRNHYLFEYDERDRLRRVSFRLGSRVRALNETANLFMVSPIMEMEYKPGRQIRRWFDRLGNPVLIRGKVLSEVFHLDSLGNRKGLTFEDKNGNAIENSWEIARYSWEITGDGTVIEERFNMAGEPAELRPHFDFYRLKLHYRMDGYLALMQNVDAAGQPIANSSGAAQDRLDFDAHGNIWGWNVLNPAGNLTRGNGPNVARGIFTPNEWGYEAGIRFEDEEGNAIPSAYGFWGSKTEFDSFGNMESRVFLKDGKPHAHERAGYTRLKLVWDESGFNRLSLAYMNENGAPVLHATRGYAVVKTRYNKQNQPSRIEFLDVANRLVERTDSGIAAIERTYNRKGLLSKLRYLDAAGNLKNHNQQGHAITVYHYDDANILMEETRYNSKEEVLAPN